MTTCEEIVPATTTAAGAGVNAAINTAGFDWVSVLLYNSGPAVSGATISVAMNTLGATYKIAGVNVPANDSGHVDFGGGGGPSNTVFCFGAAPFVPNRISIILAAVPGQTWTWAVIGGYIDH